MVMTLLLFAAGFLLSSISAVYATIGLISIFPSAPFTIGLMASALEVSKLVIASFLYRNWKEIPKFLKVYFTLALITLMFLTSMACFGYLAKSHMDSSVATGDQTSALILIDEKIATQKDNIKQDRLALTQMDAAVDELMSRTTDDQGASKAVKIRKQQASERADLNKDIAKIQVEVTKLQTERTPLASAVRKVEADVGPIRYIANTVYGDKIDDTILEKAVRMVILMIVFVLDPLAVLLLIAGNWNLIHQSTKKIIVTKHHTETTEDTTETKVVGTDDFGNTYKPDVESIPFPTTEELKEKYKDVFDNEAITQLSNWTEASLVNQTETDYNALLDALPPAYTEDELFHDENINEIVIPEDHIDDIINIPSNSIESSEATNEETIIPDLLQHEEASLEVSSDLSNDVGTNYTGNGEIGISQQTIAIGNTINASDSVSITLNDHPPFVGS